MTSSYDAYLLSPEDEKNLMDYGKDKGLMAFAMSGASSLSLSNEEKNLTVTPFSFPLHWCVLKMKKKCWRSGKI